MTWITLAIGALLGGALGTSVFGAAAGALIAWLLVQLHRQDARIGALEQAVQARQTGQAGQALRRLDELPPPAATDTAAPPALDPAAALPSPPPHAAPVFADAGPPVAARPAPWLVARAWLLGGNTIAKAGVGILFVGLAFLAKYAAEHTQVPIEARLAGIGAAAMVLLGLGWRLRSARPGFGQALQGGAVAVLYLTLFVAFRFYGVLAAGPVFALMVAVAALAAALAVLQDALALAVIGALGGFATPMLVSTGQTDPVALFSYYLVLDLGIAAVAWFKTWRLLGVVGFVFTFIVATVWGVLSYDSARYASSQAFLVAYFLLFNAVLLMPARRLGQSHAPHGDRWLDGTLLFGLPTITFVLQHGLVRQMAYGSALSALALATFYALVAWRVHRRPAMALLFDATLAIAIVFLTLVLPFALDASSTAGAWALEGAGLVWLGLSHGRRLPRAFGYALQLLAGGAWWLASLDHAKPAVVFNALFIDSLMLAAGALVAAFVVQRPDARRGAPLPGEHAAGPLLVGLGTAWALAAVHLQVDAFVDPPFESTAWLAGTSTIALVFSAVCAGLRWTGLAWPLIGFAPLLAGLAGAAAATLASPAAAGGWWAWPLALATQLVVLWRAAPHWPAPAQRLVHALGVLVLAALAALQGRSITAAWAAWGDIGSAWAWLGGLLPPAALLLLLPLPGLAQRWPVRAAPSAYQGLAGAVLAAGLMLWTLPANLFSDGSALPLPFVPLLNPLDLGVAGALLAAWLWLRRPAARDALARQPPFLAVLLAGAGFAWINAIVVRAFHHYGDVPYRFDAWVRSLAVQTGITLLWATTALVLMWLSARRRMRLPWLAGAVLLAAVVLKLLLVDLSGSGTVTRIVSFIGVGVLMLVIAYVAPLPSSAPAPEAQ